MVYQLKRTQINKRPQAFWGSLIPSALSFVGGLITSSQQAKAQRRALEEQQRLAKQQLDINNQNQLASTLNNYALAQQSYDDKDYNLKYRIGGVKRLGSRNIMITDGGIAKRIGNNTYLLRGGSHEDINETGQTGIGINVGGNEIEAEGGEVAQRKGNSLRIYSAQPILGGISPAEAIMRGYNKDRVFNAQQRFKKNNGIKDDGSAKYGFGGDIKSIWNFIRSNRNPVDNIVALATAYQILNPNSNYNKQKGKFKGGTFRGAGAGGTWTNDYKSNKGFDNFNDAYDDAVKHNAETFIFGNKRYNTLKENNPIREFNNRAVGSWRDSVVIKDRTGYGKDFGPIKGGASLIPLITETYNPKRLRHKLGGGLTSKDRGSSKHPYPSVSSKDFAGGNRSYPIPTKADAIDALRLAGLHGRSDVRSKVYSKYPELRKKARGGTKVDPYYDWARNTSSNLRVSFIDPTYDYRTYYNSVTPYERNLIRFAPQGTHFTDIGKTPKHPTFSNKSIYSNKKYPGGTWNGNVFVPNIWQFGNNGNKVRNKYMNNSGEGYFNGRVNIFPKYRKRIAKRIGGIINPPVERFKCGGRVRPKAEDGMLATIYSYGTNRRRLPSFAPIDVTPRAIPNFKPISVPTNVKTPFDPNSVPYLGKQSSFKPATQDYIGLGIDTLAALGSGMFTRSAYNKMNFDYALPNYVDESPVAFDTTYHNEAQRANIERNRLNARNLIRGNTASAQTSLGRMQQSDVDAMMETNKLLDEKSNKEVELRNQNAANEQQVRARNAAARNQYYQNVAQIKNAALEAKNNAELAKAQSIGADLSGLSQAWTNFAGSIENRYDNRQKEAIIAATAKDPAVLSNAVQFGYNFSPEVLAAIYNSTDDDNLKSLALSRLSTKNRLRYGIR